MACGTVVCDRSEKMERAQEKSMEQATNTMGNGTQNIFSHFYRIQKTQNMQDTLYDSSS